MIVIVGAMALSGRMPNALDALGAMIAACLVTALVQGAFIVRGVKARVRPATPAYHAFHWSAISLSFLMIDGFRTLLENADVLLVGRLLDSHSVALYFAAIRTGGLLAFIYFAVLALAVPRLAEIHSVGTRAELQRFVSGVIQVTFWPTLLVAIALSIVGPFALSLFGGDFAKAYPALLVVLVGLTLRAATGPVEYLLNVTGHHRDTVRVYFVCGLADVALNLVLIPRFGIVGAAASTYIAIITANICLYWLVRRRLGISAFVFPLRWTQATDSSDRVSTKPIPPRKPEVDNRRTPATTRSRSVASQRTAYTH